MWFSLTAEGWSLSTFHDKVLNVHSEARAEHLWKETDQKTKQKKKSTPQKTSIAKPRKQKATALYHTAEQITPFL